VSDEPVISYAQNGEALVLRRGTGQARGGRCVGVRTCEPVDTSVPEALCDRGRRSMPVAQANAEAAACAGHHVAHKCSSLTRAGPRGHIRGHCERLRAEVKRGAKLTAQLEQHEPPGAGSTGQRFGAAVRKAPPA
jgi:hypothetical protein